MTVCIHHSLIWFVGCVHNWLVCRQNRKWGSFIFVFSRLTRNDSQIDLTQLCFYIWFPLWIFQCKIVTWKLSQCFLENTDCGGRVQIVEMSLTKVEQEAVKSNELGITRKTTDVADSKQIGNRRTWQTVNVVRQECLRSWWSGNEFSQSKLTEKHV